MPIITPDEAAEAHEKKQAEEDARQARFTRFVQHVARERARSSAEASRFERFADADIRENGWPSESSSGPSFDENEAMRRVALAEAYRAYCSNELWSIRRRKAGR